LTSYTRTSYQENPTEALAAIIIIQDVTSIKQWKGKCRTCPGHYGSISPVHELGDDIAEHIGYDSYQQRLERATVLKSSENYWTTRARFCIGKENMI
jgi:hypothetical protein